MLGVSRRRERDHLPWHGYDINGHSKFFKIANWYWPGEPSPFHQSRGPEFTSKCTHRLKSVSSEPLPHLRVLPYFEIKLMVALCSPSASSWPKFCFTIGGDDFPKGGVSCVCAFRWPELLLLGHRDPDTCSIRAPLCQYEPVGRIRPLHKRLS